jgi:hypothetical protein
VSEEKSTLSLFWKILHNPEEGFTKVGEDDLMKGIFVQITVIIFAILSTKNYMSKIPIEVLIPQLVGVDPSAVPGNIGLLSGIGIGVSILLGWILSTLLMHGLSHLLGGKGSIRRFFAIHGMASLPYLINYLIRVIDSYSISNSDVLNYFFLNRNIDSRFFKAILDMNLLNIFGLYTLILVIYGIKDNYEISRGKTILVSIVPWLLYLALNLFMPN